MRGSHLSFLSMMNVVGRTLWFVPHKTVGMQGNVESESDLAL